MTESQTVAASVSAEKEEPPSIWSRILKRLNSRSGNTPEATAFHEAVDELMEDVGDDDGTSAAECVLLANILALRDKDAGDCMVPRAQIDAIDIDSDFDELVKLMTKHAHSRVPAYRDTLDETLGMVHMKDVLNCLSAGRACKIRDLLRPVFFVAPSMPVSKLLLQMRQTRQHMAMVVDEFGGIDGLVTIEDLVEEIVGEIEDEHDTPEKIDIIKRPDGSLIVPAALPIESFEERVGEVLTSEERENIDTLAGYVLHLAGHVPRIGDTVEGPNGLLFDILETDQARIKRVRVRGCRPVEAAKVGT